MSGDGKIDIVTPTQEFDDNPSAPATPGGGAAGGFSNFLTNFLANVLGGSGRVYAVDRDGNVLPGWPTAPNGIVPDALPFVGPGVDHVLANVDTDPELEAIGNVASGDVTATNGNGSNAAQYDSEPAGGEHVDKSKVINLFENPIAANIDGVGGPEIIKGGVTLNQVVNLGVAVGQNLPYNHVVQAWNAETGASLPTFPQAVEDFQLLSSPMVADLSDAPGNEVVVGTGLYYLRNFNVAGHRGHRLAEVHRRLDLRHAGCGRRGRRRRPRGDDAHARGLRLHVGHRPAGLRHQRRVVDLASRRVEHRQLRHRQPAARHAAAARRQPERLPGRADLDGARGRLALRDGAGVQGPALVEPDPAPRRRHRRGRLPCGGSRLGGEPHRSPRARGRPLRGPLQGRGRELGPPCLHVDRVRAAQGRIADEGLAGAGATTSAPRRTAFHGPPLDDPSCNPPAPQLAHPDGRDARRERRGSRRWSPHCGSA